MTQVTGATSAASSGTTSASQSLSSNYELFLSLLTTQIQNQDPLDPLDSAEYTNQLVQYSSVEQSIQSNQHLAKMVEAMQAGQASSYVNYIGSEITASGGTATLSNGKASWSFDAAKDATGSIDIKDSAGNTVYSKEVSVSAGSNSFDWDGRNNSGGTAPDGTYTISFNLKDGSGSKVNPSAEIKGVVDGLDLSTDNPVLKIGDLTVPVSAVRTVKAVSS